jgi:cell division septation protein DedD
VNTLLNDRDEDLDDRDLRHRQYNNGRDREITLGTTMILGIFFALAVLCAAFFGFGYSTGRHSALTTAAAGSAAPLSASNGPLKPGAGITASNPYAQPVPSDTTPAFGLPASRIPASDVAPTRPAPAPDRVVAEGPYVRPTPLPPAETTPKPARIVAVAASVPTATPVSLGTGQFMVQIAAVSHQEDGELLVTSLKRRGYNVAIHTEPQDKLLHVQIGPFNNRREADSMRQRLLGDGFNAIVK